MRKRGHGGGWETRESGRHVLDRRSLERGGATHGRVNAWAITHKEVGVEDLCD